MSEGRTAAGAAQRVGSGTSRLVRAWKALPTESRLAAYASGALFFTLFLPWYQVTLIAPAKAEKLQSASASITGWGAFSFVEAAVLLVAAGVLILLFQRAEGRAFHLPGGDGGVIFAAGLWTCLLIVWRIFDKQGATTTGPSATTSGIEWGIFVALAAAAFLAYAGSRIRAAHRPEPPLPGEDEAPAGSSAAATLPLTPRTPEARRRREERRPRPAEGRRPSEPPPAAAPAAATPPATASAKARRPPPPRRRPRPPAAEPRPVAAEPRRVGETRPVAADPRPVTDERRPVATDPRPVAAEPPSALPRPRRRVSAAELFERVVPDDPPAVPFGRVKPADVDETIRMRSTAAPDAPEPETPADEQLTMRLGSDDETLRLERD
ncbi:MAG: hypothetical protein ACLQA5_16335 [Solirubrobacteraceae bacterium]